MSPGPHRLRRNLDAGKQAADPGGRDVHAVGLAVLDDFGVAAGDSDARRFGGLGPWRDFRFQNFRRQSGFENERDDHRFGPRAGNRQIVYRAVHRQFADRAAGKTQRLHHEAVGGDRDSRAVDLNMRGVAERARGGTEQQRSEQSFDQPAAGLAAGAVRHFDLRFAEADLA